MQIIDKIILDSKILVWKFFNLLLLRRPPKKDIYISKIDKHAPWAYVSYIASVFYNRDNAQALNQHQNKREAIRIVEILNELGYNVYVQDFQSQRKLPKLRNVILVFGHNPNLYRATKKYPNAIIVRYSTGSYYAHQNSQITKMTDYINNKYKSNLPYRRMVSDGESVDIVLNDSTKVLQVGSKFTIGTYPDKYKSKIHLIHQSTQITTNIEITDAKENEFMYLGSSGNLLKGIPLLVEFFTKVTDLKLHIVGPMEEDYMAIVKDEITPNIVFHGFMNVCSQDFVDVAKKCNFIIFPSGSEGCPGSVLCAMQYGLIPIVTPWAAFDEIEEYGYLMDYNWNTNSIEQGVKWALSLTPSDRLQHKLKCKVYVQDFYNLERFGDEFKKFITETLQLIV